MKNIRRIAGIALLTIFMFLCALAIYVLLCMNQTEETQEAGVGATPRPYVEPVTLPGMVSGEVAQYFPYPSAVLTGEELRLYAQSAYDTQALGQNCRVIERVYEDGQGVRYTLKSATPAAYMTVYDEYTPTGNAYVLQEGYSALLLEKGACVCLLMRSGETVYILEAQVEREALLAAGAGWSFE